MILFATGCLDSSNHSEGQNVLVTRVIDGDTLVVQFSNQSMGTIRLLGVDCPETTLEKNNPYEYRNITNLSCLTHYGYEAKWFMESLLNNSQILISFDEQANEKDQYDRYLCYVTYDSTDVNAELIKEGYARVYTLESFSKKADYLQLESQSLNNVKGLWSCVTKKTGLNIVEVHYDAMGNDADYLNDEYVVIVNNEAESIDFTGWRITDVQGNSFNFPNGYFLAPNNSLTIYTGSGTNMSTALYLHHDMPLWNNDGDAVIIYDITGKTRVTFSW